MNSAQLQALLLAPSWQNNRNQVLRRLAHVRGALGSAEGVDQSVRDDLDALIGTLGRCGWPEGSDLAATIRDSLCGRNTVARGELVRRLDALTATLP